MSILIGNHSVSAVVYGYACTPDGLLVWLELAPQHPKVVGAIRAELSGNTRTYLRLQDDAKPRSQMVYGLGRGYLTLSVDAPQLAVGPRARAVALRMIAPQAISPEDLREQFFVLEWPGIDAASSLAAALERSSALPVQIGWGPYLLTCAISQYGAEALVTGGVAPQGYVLQPGTPWAEIISTGLKQKLITLDGRYVRRPVPQPVTND